MLNKSLGSAVDIDTILNKEINNFASQDFRGKKIVLTGGMILKRSEMELLIESMGAIIQSSVYKSTNFLVIGIQEETLQEWITSSAQNRRGWQSKKWLKANELRVPNIDHSVMIDMVEALKSAILQSRPCNFVDENLNDAAAWCKEFPFLINYYPFNKAKKLLLNNLELLKFINYNKQPLSNAFLTKIIGMDGSLLQHLPRVKNVNLQIIEAAMSATKNPKMHYCEKLLAMQIKHLDLRKFSNKERKYIWQTYKDKTDFDDLLLIAKEKEHFLTNPNNQDA
tara:strand:+ start:1404 stop:2246 length:843 start_codon:yes stop_codon:yes gene_type:complete